MFWLGLIIGLTAGTIFSATIIKYAQKTKAAAKEVAKDVQADIDKVKAKP